MVGLTQVLFILTRLICIGFLVVAGITIPEVWDLNDPNYSRSEDGTTVYVPLDICEPQSVSIDGNAVIFSGLNKCYTPEYLINACVASIFFAGAAILVFFLFDALARCTVGPITMSSVLGMSFFLSFILIQCAACCWALYKECGYREDFMLEQFENIGNTEVTTVKTHGDSKWFFNCMLFSLVTAGGLLLDTIVAWCCGHKKKKQKDQTASNHPTAPVPTATSKETNNDMEVSPTSGRPAWTSTD